jgi:hypothetical protein
LTGLSVGIRRCFRFRRNYQQGNPDHIVALRPACHGEDDRSGSIKVAITGS